MQEESPTPEQVVEHLGEAIMQVLQLAKDAHRRLDKLNNSFPSLVEAIEGLAALNAKAGKQSIEGEEWKLGDNSNVPVARLDALESRLASTDRCVREILSALAENGGSIND